MKPKILFQAIAFICFGIILNGCTPDVELQNWRPDMLLPLAHTTATIEKISDTEEKKFQQNISAADLGYSAFTPVTVPATLPNAAGPFEGELSEYFRQIAVDSMEVHIEVENNFPMTLLAGTKIVFRNEANTSNHTNIIFTHVINENISAGDTYVHDTLVKNISVRNKIYLYLEDIQVIPGTYQFSSNDTKLRFELRFPALNLVEINTNKTYAVGDTSELDLGDAEDIDDRSADGFMNIYVENGLPINFRFQVYFFEGQSNFATDSLISTYSQTFFSGAPVDADGFPISTVEDSIVVPISEARAKQIKSYNRVGYILDANTFGYTTTTATVSAKDENFMKLQLVGDMELNLNALIK